MAEENNEKSFYPFKIKTDEEKRKEKIEKYKNKYPFATLMRLLGSDADIDLDDEVALENKLRTIMHNELLSMENAANSEDYNSAATYEKSKDRNGNDVEGKIPEVLDYFQAVDSYKKYEDSYISYEGVRSEILNKDISDSEKQAQIEELNRQPQYAEAIAAKEKFEEAEKNYTNYNHDLDVLERNPKEVNRSLLKFYKQCKAAGKEEDFNKIYEEFTSDVSFRPSRSSEGKIINEHRFNLDDAGHISHSILNLDNSGLDISWVDGKLGIAHCTEKMSDVQIDALAKYCYKNEIDVTDAMKLNNLLVTDKKGDEIGKAGDVLQQKIADLRNGNEDNTPSKLDENEFSDLLGEPLRVETDPTSYIDKEKDLTVKDRAIIGAVKNRIQTIGYHDPSLTKVRKVWGSIVISVYKNENDILKDGEVDKNGVRNHTKEFSVRIKPTNPPKVYFYMEQGKEFKSSHARVVLDAMSACGSRYYVIPGGNEIGGSVFNAFMEASGKSLMIPLCKRSKDAPGVYLESDHVEAMLKVIKDENKQDSDKLLDFQIRLVRELKAQELGRCSENPNYKTNSKLTDKIDSLERTIKYTKLQNGQMTELEKFINAGLAGAYGRKWDEVDRAAALVALKHITEDIGKGLT